MHPRKPSTGLAMAAAALLAAALGCGKDKPSRQEGRPALAAPSSRLTPAEAGDREQALIARLANAPDDVDALLAMANLYYDTDRPHRAVPLYIEVLQHRPDDAAVRTDLGTCYKRMDQLDKARAEYERVLEKHPEHPQATYNLAVVSHLAGDELRAATLWERVAALAPGTAAARNALALAAEARAAAAKATSAVPTKRESHP